MPPVTGADLPSEVIAKILSYFMVVVRQIDDGYRSWKHALVAPSLVCKYWAECIRPALFQDINLEYASDLSFLEDIIHGPRFNNSSLNGAIKLIRAEHHFPPLPEPWIHHLHSLMMRLPMVLFTCDVWNDTEGSGRSVPVRWPPFAALPRVPPSFYSIRLSVIQITGSTLKSTTELARLVDSFPALQECSFSRLKFLDPSPIIRARRIPRKVPRALWRCEILECADMSILDQARLALDLLAAAPRLGLAAEDPQWSALLDALLASVPSGFKQARMTLHPSGGGPLDGQAPGKVVLRFSPTTTSGPDQLVADAWVTRARATPTRPEDAPAYVSAISLTAGFATAEDGDPPSFDGFRGSADSARFEQLRFWVREGNAQEEAGMRALLRSVLRREQLTWALERGILRLQHSVFNHKINMWDSAAYIDSSTILSILADRSFVTINDTPPTLDDDEYAEYLSLFFAEKRADYLRRLPALRAERAAASAHSLTAIPRHSARDCSAARALAWRWEGYCWAKEGASQWQRRRNTQQREEPSVDILRCAALCRSVGYGGVGASLQLCHLTQHSPTDISSVMYPSPVACLCPMYFMNCDPESASFSVELYMPTHS
ncbi:hypothetical protein PsYK624_170280 [Phanerochaete sordida]|uniref:F-box domain-containing protein n=1 Tax=Phanerochaete sordida TaxID=48140 RepID=A0A9P3GRU6_9APHY|nr:hypothetical protein PsYK624_170280 [Phanerochaete sordida]